MNYSKPEVAILGEATRLIQGQKDIEPENGLPVPGPDAFERES